MVQRSGVTGASVEGEKLSLKTRQFHHYPPKRTAAKVLQFPFKLGIRSEAEIAEVYESQESLVYESSFCEKGDSVLGVVIDGWSRKPFGEPNISKGSASHSASFLTISGGCFARVMTSPKELLDNADFQKANPPIVLKLRSKAVPSETTVPTA